MEQANTPSTGIVGLGIIGSRAAAVLRRSGYKTWVWNRSPRPEPNFLSSPAEVAETVKTIQIFVSDGPALLDVLDRMAPVLTPNHIVINHATVSPEETLRAASIVQGRHAAFLDAPFTGSRDVAARGQLVYYVGGPPDAIARARPLLEITSRQILEVGDIGQATAVKVATNIMAASQVAALAEALAFLDRHDVPLHVLAAALENNAARSGISDMKLPAMLADDFEPRFSLANMFKDMRIALDAAHRKDLELPSAATFTGTAMAALQRDWGASDFSVVARLFDFPGKNHSMPEPAPAAPAPEPTPPPPPLPAPRSSFSNLWGLLAPPR
jgi:3-hydroxyisobutyrate dehydrogenase-like beta-hydroxyacid dehydrogenase